MSVNKINGLVPGMFPRFKNMVLGIHIRYYCLLLFFAKVYLEVVSFTLSPDISNQLNSLYNLSHGRGIVITAFRDNAVHFQLYNGSASGLVLFLLPINLLIHNTIISTFILDITGLLFFVVFLYKFMALLKIDTRLQKLILFFFAVVQSPFVYQWSSDLLSMVLCLWGIYFIVKNLQTKKWGDLLPAFLFLGLSYLVRYAYLPLLFAPFLINLCVHFKFDKTNAIKLSKILALTFITGIIIFLLNYWMVGQRVEELKTDGKIHFEHLAKIDGFLFHIGHYELRLDQLLGGGNRFLLIAQVLTFITFVYFGFKILVAKKLNENKKVNPIIPMITGVVTFLTLSFLILLSLMNPSPSYWPGWTYTVDTRYYSVSIIMAYFFILIYLFYFRARWLFATLASVILLLNILAFRSLITGGKYGENLSEYLKTQSSFKNNNLLSDSVRKPVVVYEPATVFSKELYTLTSLGYVYVIDKPSFNADEALHGQDKFIFLSLEPENNRVVLKKYQQ